jgi:hypothetical protein
VLKEKEKVFYVPGPELAAIGNNNNGKVVTGTVTRAGIQCSCCDTAMPLPAFTSHAGAGAETLQPVWERLLLMSGKPLLRCVQEAWEKERVSTFRAEEKVKSVLEQDRQRSAQAKKKLLAANGNGSANSRQNRKGPLALKGTNGGGGDRSDDACGICADGGQLLCCDSCPSTFHPECLGVQVPKGSWVCHYCRCFVCLATDGDLATCQQCARKRKQSTMTMIMIDLLVCPWRRKLMKTTALTTALQITNTAAHRCSLATRSAPTVAKPARR